jgi:hypothetical protein
LVHTNRGCWHHMECWGSEPISPRDSRRGGSHGPQRSSLPRWSCLLDSPPSASRCTVQCPLLRVIRDLWALASQNLSPRVDRGFSCFNTALVQNVSACPHQRHTADPPPLHGEHWLHCESLQVRLIPLACQGAGLDAPSLPRPHTVVQDLKSRPNGSCLATFSTCP